MSESWIPAYIQSALASEPYEAEDDLFGVGEGHWFGPSFESRVAFYPDHKTVEYEDPNVYLVVTKPSRLLVGEDAVFVSTRHGAYDSHLSVGRDGTLSVMSQGPRPVRDDETPAARDSQAVDESITEPPKERKKQPRKEVLGRLGRVPHFRETPRGKTLARFPVAEHSKDDAGEDVTNWHLVVAFNALADSLKAQVEAEELKQGDEIRVIGYEHQRMVPDGRGGMKQQDEIFAAVVKKPKKKEFRSEPYPRTTG